MSKNACRVSHQVVREGSYHDIAEERFEFWEYYRKANFAHWLGLMAERQRARHLQGITKLMRGE